MTFIERVQILERLHHLIRRRGTGSPAELAARLYVSERTIYNLLDDLKALGAKISYCKSRRSYFYEKDFSTGFLFQSQGAESEKNIKGGAGWIYEMPSLFIIPSMP